MLFVNIWVTFTGKFNKNPNIRADFSRKRSCFSKHSPENLNLIPCEALDVLAELGKGIRDIVMLVFALQRVGT